MSICLVKTVAIYRHYEELIEGIQAAIPQQRGSSLVKS